MIAPMNTTHFYVVPKERGVALTIEIDGKVVITSSAALGQIEEVIDALENVQRSEDSDEAVVMDEG